MESLKYTNFGLLTLNNSLSTCCCGGEQVPTGYYYEAISCNGFNRLRYDGICDEWDQCHFGARNFVYQYSKCNEGEIKICECQLLRFDYRLPDFVRTGQIAAAVDVHNFTAETLTVDWTSTTITFSLSGGSTFIFEIAHNDLNDLFLAVNTWNSFVSVIANILGSISPFAIKEATKVIPPGGSTSFISRYSGLYFVHNGNIDISGALASTDLEIFRQNINVALNRLISDDMVVSYNDQDEISTERFYEMKFSGSLCGSRQNKISGYNVLFDINNQTQNIQYHYGEYYDPDHYLKTSKNGSRHFISQTPNLCAYDDIISVDYTKLYTLHTGPTAPQIDDILSCCPQGGATFGENQYVGFSTSGYAFHYLWKHWWNLEHTIYTDGCRVLPPEFFTVSKRGRHDFVHSYDKPLHLTCDCDFPTSCSSGTDNLPTNCTPELFIGQFHKDVPWGPFGSYYAGIERDEHPAWLFPYNDEFSNPFGGQSYLSAAEICSRQGWDYKPTGAMIAVGTWRQTERIDLFVDIKRPMPFHVGTATFDEKDYRCQISTGVIPSGMTITGNDGCQPTFISYSTSGKTVGNFIDDINSLNIVLSGMETSGTRVFSFCAASESAKLIPLKRIMNTSSELFEQQKDSLNSSIHIGGTGPENDLYKDRISGQSFPSVPLSYPDMHTNSVFNIVNASLASPTHPRYILGLPTGLDGYVGIVPDIFTSKLECGVIFIGPDPIKTPPICRWFNKHLPLEGGIKTDPATEFLYNSTMWWTPIIGREEDVISISKSGIDDQVTNLTLQVNTGSIVVRSYSGATIFNSGILRITGYTTYTAQECANDLNNFRFTYITGVGTYQPISAIYNTGLIQVPLFIHNSISHSTGWDYGRPVSGFANTIYNYGYQESPSDKIETSIFTTSEDIITWLRKRCGRIESLDNTIIPVNNFCVPPDAKALANDVNCDGDQSVNNGWLHTYGCGSPRCKTEYFLKATRCSCDQVYRCDGTEGNFVGHPYNFEGGEAHSQTYGNELMVSQPTFYLCEYNLHPDCNVPMMVKVPFQVNDGSRNVLWHNGSFGTFYNSLAVGPDFVNGITNLTCEFCNNDITYCGILTRAYSNVQGWCQYLDPEGIKVRFEDIPLAWPAQAVIALRSTKPFCSFNHWNFKPEYILAGSVTIGNISYGCKPDDAVDCVASAPDEGINCNSCPDHDTCPNCLNYDRIVNCKPIYDTGINNEDSLTVLLRPIYHGDENPVCDPLVESVCNHYDITCATSCCECFFVCDPATADCLQKVSHPFIQYMNYDSEKRYTGYPGICAPSHAGGPGCGHVVFGCCTSNCNVFPCYSGECEATNTNHIHIVKTSCNCIAEGCLTEEPSVCVNVTCAGAPVGTVCRGEYIPGEPPNLTIPPNCNYTCSNIPSTLSGGDLCCGEPCLIGVKRDFSGCSFLADIYLSECWDEEIGLCEEYDATFTKIYEERYFGISPVDNVALGIYSACEWHGTQKLESFESLHIEDKDWTSCPYTTPIGVGYNYVKNLRLAMPAFTPGYGSIAISSGNSPTSDPRFFGPLGC